MGTLDGRIVGAFGAALCVLGRGFRVAKDMDTKAELHASRMCNRVYAL